MFQPIMESNEEMKEFMLSDKKLYESAIQETDQEDKERSGLTSANRMIFN